MKRRLLTVANVLLSLSIGLITAFLVAQFKPAGSEHARAAPLALNITGINPAHAPNDLDARITISGSGFISTPEVFLGPVALEAVSWLSNTALEANVPWGMDPAVYTLTVINPNSEASSMPDAFSVTQGIGAWTPGELYGGEIENIAINPLTPTTLYAAAENVGLFRSRDGGANWSFIYAPSANYVTVDPLAPSRLYWSDRGKAYRSDNEGESWTTLPGALGEKFYAHPSTAGTLFASRHEGAPTGLWKSQDFGQTWVTLTQGLSDTQVYDVAFYPGAPLTMALGTSNGNIFISSDGGNSWSFASQPVQYAQTLAFNPNGDHELWVSDCCFCVPQYTYKSSNLTYTQWISTLAAPLRDIAFPDPASWGATYSQTVYAAGCWADAYKSDDNGATWSDWGPGSGSWGWSIALDPHTAGVIYKASHRDSIYKTSDGGQSWQVSNHGLTAMSPQQLEGAPGHPNEVYALFEGWEGIFKSTQGGATWQFLETEAADQALSSIMVSPHDPERIYKGGNQEIARSDDGGLTWALTGTLAPPPACSIDVQLVSAKVIKSDPQQGGTLLAGTNILCNEFNLQMGGIYSSSDAAATWTLIDVGQPLSQVLDMEYDVLTPSIVYAATDGSGMLRSSDGGQHWQAMAAGIAELDVVRSIAVEPVAPYRVFAAGNGLYVSTDHGVTWTQVVGWLQGVEELLCTYEPPSTLYAATTSGLLQSTDGGQAWSRAAGTLGHVPIYALDSVTASERVFLYAGTTGGYVESTKAHTARVNANGDLVPAGVYRYTTRRTWNLYLPLLLKTSTPAKEQAARTNN